MVKHARKIFLLITLLSFVFAFFYGIPFTNINSDSENKSSLVGKAEAATTCSNTASFTDNFANYNLLDATKNLNIAVAAEAYTTNGTIGTYDATKNTTNGVRIRNFYDPLTLSRPGGRNLSDNWIVGFRNNNNLNVSTWGGTYSENVSYDYDTTTSFNSNWNIPSSFSITNEGIVTNPVTISNRANGVRMQTRPVMKDIAGKTRVQATAARMQYTWVNKPTQITTQMRQQIRGGNYFVPVYVAGLGYTDRVSGSNYSSYDVYSNRGEMGSLRVLQFTPAESYVNVGQSPNVVYTAGAYDPGQIASINMPVSSTTTSPQYPTFDLTNNPSNPNQSRILYANTTDPNFGTYYRLQSTYFNNGHTFLSSGTVATGHTNNFTSISEASFAMREYRLDWAKTAEVYSTTINLGTNSKWGIFNASHANGSGSVQYQIWNGGAWIPIANGEDVGTKIGGATSTQLRAILSRPSALQLTPTLNSWGISCPTSIINQCLSITPATVNLSTTAPTATITVTGTTTNIASGGRFLLSTGAWSTYYNPSSKQITNPATGQYSMTLNLNFNTDPNLNNPAGSILSVRVESPALGLAGNCTAAINLTPIIQPQIVNENLPGNGGVIAGCHTVESNNPYKISITLNAVPSTFAGAKVNRITGVIIPMDDTANYQFNRSSGALVSGLPANRVFFNSESPTANVTILSKDFNASPARVTFNLDLTSLYSNYYGTQASPIALNRIGIAAYVSDTDGRTNQDNDPSNFGNKTLSNDFQALDSCAKLFYQTSNGDIRSSEKGEYDRVLKPNGVLTPVFKQTPDGVNSSDYGYSWKGTGMTSTACAKYAKAYGFNSDFCKGPVGTGILTTQISSFNDKLITLDSHPKIQLINVPSTTTSINLADPTYAGTDPANKTILIKVNSANITITDSINNPPAIHNVIIWCPISCNMTVIALGTSATATAASMQTRSRLYFNNGGNINFQAIDPNAVNVYNGAFITSGYLKTDNSTNTNFINGMVSARGIIAGGVNVSNQPSNLYLNFRNFYSGGKANPFLFIQYDPKYLYIYKDFSTIDAESVPRELVGI